MTSGLAPLCVVRRRMAAQRLMGAPFGSAAEAVAWSGAVQAQEYAEALWSVGMRAGDHSADDVEAACDRGEILRTHVLRPTWHFVAAGDLRWLLRLTGARVQAKTAGRRRELGLDDATLARCNDALATVLGDGDPRTRRELGAALEAAGIDLAGQRLPHALGHAELDGVIASGPRRGKQHTYLLVEGRVPAAPQRSREADVAELVRRYFTSHGPATLRDFAWWSGLTMADGRAGLAALGEELVAQERDGTLWICAAAPAPGDGPDAAQAFLLGTFDELTVAHRDLRNVHADGRATNELLTRPILVDATTVGGWTRRLARREVTIEAVLDAAPDERQGAALRAAADRFGAFLGLRARLEIQV
jgi:hypothetical protein